MMQKPIVCSIIYFIVKIFVCFVREWLMSQDKRCISSWLVGKSGYAKAKIKYEIRQHEAQLKRLLTNDANFLIIREDVINFCVSLSNLYLDLIKEASKNKLADNRHYSTSVHFQTWRSCFAHIFSLTQKFKEADGRLRSLHYAAELYQQYLNLAELIKKHGVESNSKAIDKELIDSLNEVIKSITPSQWLDALVNHANYINGDMRETAVLISTLSEDNLRRLSSFFTSKEYVDLVRSIFFYKLNPQKLHIQPLYSDTSGQVKSKINNIYKIIERLHKATIRALAHIGIGPIQDYLLHSDELPVGVEIGANSNYRFLISAAIDAMEISSLYIENEHYALNKVYDLFRAYKFRFKPQRLIDSSMLLHQFWVDDANQSNTFAKMVVDLFSKLPTTACLDLYGYFANKDTCYLMHSLRSSYSHEGVSWRSKLTSNDKLAIKHVYEILSTITESLRDELIERQIKTKPYEHKVLLKSIIPGRRNRTAIEHAITVYAISNLRPNDSKLDSLFELFN